MSALLSPTNSPQWATNGVANVFADEANALHELGRFRDEADAFRRLLQSLNEGKQERPVSRDTVRRLAELGRELAAFARDEFDPESSGAAPHRPYMIIVGDARLAIERVARDLNRGAQDGVSGAINNLRLTWDTAHLLPGLANWPTYLRALKTAHDALPEGLQQDGRIKLLFKRQTQQWLRKTTGFLYGEGLLMESFQSPRLDRLARELLTDVERATDDLRRAYAGRPSSLVEGKPISAGQAAQRLAPVIELLDEVETLGQKWVDSACADVDVILADPAFGCLADDSCHEKLIQSLEISPIRPGDRSAVLVYAHPDDEARSAGVVETLKSQGYKVIGICMTDGSGGEPQEPGHDTPFNRRNLPAIRTNETLEAAVAAGFDQIEKINYGDSGMPDAPSQHQRRLGDVYRNHPERVRATLNRIFSRYEPDLVLAVEAQPPYDHTDHEVTALVTAEAVQQLSEQGHKPELYWISVSPAVMEARYKALGLEELIGPMPQLTYQPNTVIAMSNDAVVSQVNVHTSYGSQIAGDGRWSEIESDSLWLRRDQVAHAAEPATTLVPGNWHSADRPKAPERPLAVSERRPAVSGLAL